MDQRLPELARVFIRLGLTSFGGPAAHLAIMQREFVDRRHWLTRERLVDLIGLSSLLPGPSSTEVALGIGFERARWTGLGIAALGFIGPAAIIVLILAAIYSEVGMASEVRYLLYGMAPVVIAVIGHAMLKLVPTALTDVLTWIVGVGALGLALVTGQPLLVLAMGASVLLVVRRLPELRAGPRGGAAMALLPSLDGPIGPVAVAAGAAATSLGVATIFLTFLKVGVVVFGSGYVLIAFLGAEFVEPGYISEQELLDAIAIGQLTPGPVFTTATFIGYLLAGVPGAVVATAGIFLPAVILVGVAHPWLDRIRRDRSLSLAIDGVNAAAIGLIGYAIVLLAQEAFMPDGTLDPFALVLGGGAFAVLLSGRAGPVPLLLVGALLGLGWQLVR